MDNYLTPGVYVKEISTLTGVVTEVASAIPAFIGHTRNTRYDGRDLVGVPEAISSFKDFEERFGGPPGVFVDSVTVKADDSGRFQSVESVAFAKRFLLYHSVYAFFRNGGGNCFVISTGSYETEKFEKKSFLDALNAAESVDDITLLVMPEATLLEDDDIYGVQQEALSQCNRRMNRFAILDMLEQVKKAQDSEELVSSLLHWKNSPDTENWKKGIQGFRDNIGISYLSYGAAYTPYIIADVPVAVDYKDIKDVLRKEDGRAVALDALDPDAETTIAALDKAMADRNALMTAIESFEEELLSDDMNAYINNCIAGLFDEKSPECVHPTGVKLWGALGPYAASVVSELWGTGSPFSFPAKFSLLFEGGAYRIPPGQDADPDAFSRFLTDASKGVLLEIGASITDDAKLKTAVEHALAKENTTGDEPGRAGELSESDKLAIVMNVFLHRLGKAVRTKKMEQIAESIGGMSADDVAVCLNYKTSPEASQEKIRELAGIVGTGAFPALSFQSAMRSLAGVREGSHEGAVDGGEKPLSSDLATYAFVQLKSYLDQHQAAFGFTGEDVEKIEGAKEMQELLDDLVDILKNKDVHRKSADLLLAYMHGVLAEGISSNVKRLSDGLPGKSHVFKSIVSAVQTGLRVQPPSAAMAGLYAAVDNERGVWKAPANVSLMAVKGLTQVITAGMQESLNADSVAGKSINAIRRFPGKGMLVWGARTLDGNSLEWRYIPVRRFFIMVEESLKRATAWAVFEPNDATLWSKIKAMADNYLLQKWKEGALMGASTAEAFNVGVGLGVTMTEQDILEGRLIVDVGMAVVRPAEFVILRFMHKVEPA